MQRKIIVLTFSDWYLPGYKGGGCIRGVSNTVVRLSDEFQFKVLTRDRDAGAAQSYPGVLVDSWQKVGNAEVMYLSPPNLSIGKLQNLISTTEHHILYLNSFFSLSFTIKPLFLRWLGLIPREKCILAPRGELSSKALALKSFKKQTYLAVAKSLDLCRSVMWQAASSQEENDIYHNYGQNQSIVIAPDLPEPIEPMILALPRRKKATNYLKILFLSRVSRVKNLAGALKMLMEVKGNIQFNIYGPIQEKDYWAECERLIALLADNIKVQYQGDIQHSQVVSVMREHDLFYLPTLGESFGYVILEALVSGCPVLISDRTPWRNLEQKGVGWDIPLHQPEAFQNILQQCVEMDEAAHRQWSQRAQEYGIEYSHSDALIEKHRILFRQAILHQEQQIIR